MSLSTERQDISTLRSRLADYMDRHGLRSTAQRRLVTETFFKSDGHLSIEDLWAKVRRRDPRVGYATVYRTLKLLRDSGIASERRFGDGVSRYEVAHEDEHHDHLICTDCGKIVEFEDHEIEALQDALARRHGFRLTRHRHELYGTCSDCQAKSD
jgi:Fur family ferric uptake transcriptional regulator